MADSSIAPVPSKEYVCSCGRECRIYYDPSRGPAASRYVQHPGCLGAHPTPVLVIGQFLCFDEKRDDGKWVTVQRA